MVCYSTTHYFYVLWKYGAISFSHTHTHTHWWGITIQKMSFPIALLTREANTWLAALMLYSQCVAACGCINHSRVCVVWVISHWESCRESINQTQGTRGSDRAFYKLCVCLCVSVMWGIGGSVRMTAFDRKMEVCQLDTKTGLIDWLCWSPKSVGLIIWGPSMSIQNVTAIHPIIVGVFLSEPSSQGIKVIRIHECLFTISLSEIKNFIIFLFTTFMYKKQGFLTVFVVASRLLLRDLSGATMCLARPQDRMISTGPFSR